MNWNTTSWNFGPVKESATLEFNFVYYKGDIKSVETSCGCTAVLRTKNRLTIELKTGKVIKGNTKIKNVTIKVVTSDNLVHDLALHATILKNE